MQGFIVFSQRIVSLCFRMEDIARYLDISATAVREINLFQRGDKTHYGQHLEECSLQRCWNECKLLNNYEGAKKDIER